MSFDGIDASDRMAELLHRAGYRIAVGNGWNSRELEEGEGDDGEFADSPALKKGAKARYSSSLDGYWFTWGGLGSGSDLERGDTFSCAMAALTSAMEHFFENATIPRDNVLAVSDERERATLIAALHVYQQVHAECGGDVPNPIETLRSANDTLTPLDMEETSELIERLRGC